MRKWEYQIHSMPTQSEVLFSTTTNFDVSVSPNWDGIRNLLKEMGQKGWELIQCGPKMIFKREIEQPVLSNHSTIPIHGE